MKTEQTRQDLRRAIAATLAMWACCGVAARAEEAGTANSAVSDSIQAVPDIQTLEQAVNDVIRGALREGGKQQGAWQTLQGKRLAEIDPRSLALSALTRNLSIQRGHLRKDVAAAAVQEAKALFDPVLNLSFNYNDVNEFERKEHVVRFKKGTVVCPDSSGTNTPNGDLLPPAGSPADCSLLGRAVVPGDEKPYGTFNNISNTFRNFLFFEEGPVMFLALDQPRPEGFKEQDETAHSDSVKGHDETYNVDFTVDQQLPWGANISFNYETKYHVADFIVAAGSLNEFAGTYHRPWTSALAATLSMPLPETKNWGAESAAADVTNRLAVLNDERAVWDVKTVINDTLLQVDLAFWGLVRASNNLYSATENLRSVEQLLAKTERMYELREITDYHRSQVQAELERVRGDVEAAKAAYIRASDALQPLLTDAADTVYLPIDYSASLVEPLTVDPAAVNREAVRSHPLLKTQDYDVKASQVFVRQADLQRRPDIALSANVSAGQSGSVFGFHEWTGSTAYIFDPDFLSQNYALTYTRPLGNRAIESTYVQSQHALKAQELAVRGTENLLARSLADAAVSVVSARALTEINRRNWELALRAYGKAADQQRSRTVTEYEIIQQSGNLLNAHRSWVDAVVAAKQAEAGWLAARGDLPARYAERTAQTMTETARVRALADARLVPIFHRKIGDDE